MQATYHISGMHCDGCAAKLTTALREHPGISEADVAFSSQSARITADETIELEELQSLLAAEGDYTISPQTESAALPATTTEQPAESLWPLGLIVLYLLGTVLVVAAVSGAWQAEPMMRHFMAGFFLVFSFFKLLDLRGFVSTYRGYDLLARKSEAWAWAYPFVELLLGVLYLTAVVPLFTNVATLVLMLVGTIGVALVLLNKQQIRCACLGTALNLPMTKVTLIENLTMAVMAGGMIVLELT